MHKKRRKCAYHCRTWGDHAQVLVKQKSMMSRHPAPERFDTLAPWTTQSWVGQVGEPQGTDLVDGRIVLDRTHAGNHQVLVHIESSASGKQDVHGDLLWLPAGGPRCRTLPGVLWALVRPWRQYGVLAWPQVRLNHGLSRTKGKPTSGPGASEEDNHVSCIGVACRAW